MPATRSPAIAIVKSANATGFAAPGVTVTYSYKVTNTGNVTLNPVTVTDPMPGLSAITCPASSLAPTIAMTCTATYTTTQTDVNDGSISNTGTAAGTPPSGAPVTASSSLEIPATRTPAIGLLKTASITSFSAPGRSVTYSYKVTNTGNVTLNPVTVTDPMPGLSAIACPNSTLAPGGTQTCTATYTTTQADLDAGSIHNTGTATGTPPSGSPVTAQSTVTIPAVATPSIGLVKSANMSCFSATGTLITYSYKVTNTGNVTLTSVGVTDPMTGLSAISCPSTTLAVGAAETCTATYTTTQADLDAGSIHNTGTATGTPPSGGPVTAQSSVTIPSTQTPVIKVVKSASVSSYSSAGTPITYSYKVTNTGNVTLHSIAVTDPMTGLSAITCPPGTLAPGASESCTASYTTTQTDVDNGSISNTGTAAGKSPTGVTVTNSSTLVIPAVQGPNIALTKTASPTTYSAAGTTITYSYLVTNTGNTVLQAVGVSDPMHGLSAVACPLGTLPVGQSETCTATYITTQADVDAGSITNTAVATGTSTLGVTVTAEASRTVPAVQIPPIDPREDR